ncbi:hypothetical protein AWB79_06570 [Caballeronia hypogeia]|uniref:Uncharacterized protein n=1 Tax=Caballeronia hypogeia TaxID=1777140 RepID=A0A158D899_9BURK|nr:hypothetical protein AWB79_06570 [Caballeronia hypogeia]
MGGSSHGNGHVGAQCFQHEDVAKRTTGFVLTRNLHEIIFAGWD